jgi:uncharacterized OsmC-like protein
MRTDELRALQAPLKERYREDPDAAVITLRAAGEVGEGVSCRVEAGGALVEAGLHPATGGTGLQVCSGDMLLEALVACAGVTLTAVATALGLEVRGGRVSAEGDLGVDREAPVGFRAIRMAVELDADLDDEQRATLLRLTERYCVVLQTIRSGPHVDVALTSGAGPT